MFFIANTHSLNTNYFKKPKGHWTKGTHQFPLPEPKLRIGHIFGYNLHFFTRLFTFYNLISVEELSPHLYFRKFSTNDNKGITSTCSMGFVDIAHVRVVSDYSLYVFSKIIDAVKNNRKSFKLPKQGGELDVYLNLPLINFEDDIVDTLIKIAQKITFELSAWHEIVSLYGRPTYFFFSEKPSAFSPEDIYSNALGAHLFGKTMKAIYKDPTKAEISIGDYNSYTTKNIQKALTDSRPLNLKQIEQFLDDLDQKWWSSQLLYFQDSHLITREANIRSPLKPKITPVNYCPNVKPLEIPISTKNNHGTILDDLYSFRIMTNLSILKDNFHNPIESYELQNLIDKLIKKGLLFPSYFHSQSIDVTSQ